MTFDARETSRNLGEPFQLFRFISGSSVYRYTTADHTILVGTESYVPNFPMQSAEFISSETDVRGKLNFEVAGDHEVASLFTISVPRTLTLTIFEGHENETEVRAGWSGRVVACEWKEDDTATISCESLITVLERNGLPYKFGSTCQHSLYRGGCNLDIYANSWVYPISAINGSIIAFDDLIGHATDDFAAGLVIAKGVDYRMVTFFNNSSGSMTLIRPFEGIAVGEYVRVARGCIRTSARCKALGNFANFLGFETVPNRNPFEGLTKSATSQGGVRTPARGFY